jgi:hypothetical protein
MANQATPAGMDANRGLRINRAPWYTGRTNGGEGVLGACLTPVVPSFPCSYRSFDLGEICRWDSQQRHWELSSPTRLCVLSSHPFLICLLLRSLMPIGQCVVGYFIIRLYTTRVNCIITLLSLHVSALLGHHQVTNVYNYNIKGIPIQRIRCYIIGVGFSTGLSSVCEDKGISTLRNPTSIVYKCGKFLGNCCLPVGQLLDIEYTLLIEIILVVTECFNCHRIWYVTIHRRWANSFGLEARMKSYMCFAGPRKLSWNKVELKTKNWTPWPESTSELYRQSVCRLSAKLVSTFADRGCHYWKWKRKLKIVDRLIENSLSE